MYIVKRIICCCGNSIKLSPSTQLSHIFAHMLVYEYAHDNIIEFVCSCETVSLGGMGRKVIYEVGSCGKVVNDGVGSMEQAKGVCGSVWRSEWLSAVAPPDGGGGGGGCWDRDVGVGGWVVR